MAAIDLSRIPGKKDDPYRGQAVHKLPTREEEHKIKIPAIPDFRFESAYLSALRPFVSQLDDQASRPPDSKKEEIAGKGGQVSEVRFDYGVPIKINWPAVLWLTLRDQVIVQFVTGGLYATWAIFGTPLLQSMRLGVTRLFNPSPRPEMKSALRHLPKRSRT